MSIDYALPCGVCHEKVAWDNGQDRWVHGHSGDAECWTGDGSTAYPETQPVCPNCRHRGHDGKGCWHAIECEDPHCDLSPHSCACSWPDPYNRAQIDRSEDA